MAVETTGEGAFLCLSDCPPLSRLPLAVLLSVISAALVQLSPVFLLQNGVVHRDLKLENILLDDNCNIKVKLRQRPPPQLWRVGVAGGCGFP